ncbi:MAG: ABC transporter ATP-binding protein [Chelatococcus sp.]|uniref:ABC transporter ATP-binding protein n=1 Tax=unclassified Chelatococcus TaxID=2638111 RepID=UPI001BCE3C6A|nr:MULTISPECIES: ABC transporter ATP-binding protein [unclassified Chelatococcus]CAH1654267.1 High-affinity branched-chain amino acid transport ATP-binding protein BraG [Hyphomicrobiales bacterium]MBS7742804.1 ABC transporter ATP-binding protein [Chelatococcus sp. HY11]MBX3538455.1 ABC transporter ATP-binding protein [Chelatococcus sp.]MBX3542078.1 ABC transporter ATP-binding protein [Chelatococcus sp.]MCO5074030.1 ABC transporter ATP-binding protein [Chelatococcus sp.]
MSLLEVEGLHAHYGKSHILSGVSLDVGEKETVAVLGRNGSGRSTMLKALIGLVPPSAGSVRLEGHEVAGLEPHQIVRRGMSYVPEERLVFDLLTVDENLAIGTQPGIPGAPRWSNDDMYAYFPRLAERRNTRAGKLSGGEQQMLTICRSLLCHPKVILIDEPTEGLAPKIVEGLVEVMRDIARRGVAIVIVEQKMTIALRIADRCLVMGHGHIVFSGTPERLRSDADVRRSWLEVA